MRVRRRQVHEERLGRAGVALLLPLLEKCDDAVGHHLAGNHGITFLIVKVG